MVGTVMAISLEEAVRRIRAANVDTAPVMRTISLIGERNMKRRTHVLTGTLRRSVTSTATATEARWGTNLKYARFENYGTRFRPAHPFAEPSLDDTLPEAERLIVGEADRLIDGIANG